MPLPAPIHSRKEFPDLADEDSVSIFISLNQKNYKLPDALTLGRGYPFDIGDRTLARAHARLTFKKNTLKIKDLGSDCGIMVNGHKIKPNKFHLVKPGDKILLGNVPLEIYESLEAGQYTEIQHFTTKDVADYAPYIYGSLFALAGIVAWTESSGALMDDFFFLGIVAAFLKVASVVTLALRTVYFPVQVVVETNLTYEGVTFHLTGKKNFSIKFSDIDKWYIVGRCFFIRVYKRSPVFLLNEGHEELATLLRERCPKKRALGEPILEKLALLPFIFVLVSWTCLYFTDTRFFHFLGHGFGFLGLGGLTAMFFSEHLRELLPLPSTIPQKSQALALGGVMAVTIVMQFSQFQNHRRISLLKKSLVECSVDQKACKKVNFIPIVTKKLDEDEEILLRRICEDGNLTACPQKLRRPAQIP